MLSWHARHVLSSLRLCTLHGRVRGEGTSEASSVDMNALHKSGHTKVTRLDADLIKPSGRRVEQEVSRLVDERIVSVWRAPPGRVRRRSAEVALVSARLRGAWVGVCVPPICHSRGVRGSARIGYSGMHAWFRHAAALAPLS
jgi:hypothetical protein